MYGSVLDHSGDEIRRMMHTNYDGTVWTVRAGVPAMLQRTGSGDIVIVSSVAGFRGSGDEAIYAGTKFAQVGLAGSLDRELREKGIRVTADNVAHAVVYGATELTGPDRPTASLALPRLEAWISLIDHVDATASTYDLRAGLLLK